MSQVIVVTAPDPAGGTINVEPGQRLYLFFVDDATFCCDNAEAFQPRLPNGESFKAKTPWGPAVAAPGYVGQNVTWGTGAYDSECEDDVQQPPITGGAHAYAAMKPDIAPLVAHVIHVGPGSIVGSLEKRLKDPLVERALLKYWKETEQLLEVILAHAEELPSTTTAVLQQLLKSGNAAFEKHRPE